MEILIDIFTILGLWLLAGTSLAFFIGPYLKGKDIDK